MTIEIGESLLYSWLKHIKKCQIVEMNWGVSPKWNTNDKQKTDVLKEIYDTFKNGNSCVFKKSELNQLVNQAEVDVVGISFENDKPKLYMADVAFHMNGLHYGDTNENVSRVSKKCIRAALCGINCFNIENIEIIFATPKLSNECKQQLLKAAADIEDILNKYANKIKVNIVVKMILGEEFVTEIYKKVVDISNNVADTNELFVRSIRYVKMFDNLSRNKKQKSSDIP